VEKFCQETPVSGRGTLIAIEGIDGSGKGTQAAKLVDALKAGGRTAVVISFPRYKETFFGARVGDFLNGEFGGLGEVHPLLAATLFAGDRFESKSMLEEALVQHQFVILDRYVASNIAHQAAKRGGEERKQLSRWIEWLEFETYEMPQADRTILLDISAEQAQQLISKKSKRVYTDQSRDLQEADAGYLAAVRQVYLDLAATESNWTVVPVETAGALNPIDEIAHQVFKAATAGLPEPRPFPPA
jgi:dTMP kinase